MPKNVQTATQLHSFHKLIRFMLKILPAGLWQYMNWELLDVQLGLEKVEEE